MKHMKYSEILKLNFELGRKLTTDPYEITMLSNIVVNPIKEICEYSLRITGLNAELKFGHYDNIVQDSIIYRESNLVIVFWELCNIVDGMQSSIELFEPAKMASLFEKIKSEINLVFKNLEKTSLVLFNTFSGMPFHHSSIGRSKFETLADRLNQFVGDNLPQNVRLVNLDKIYAKTGMAASLDFRYYYSSKALYSVDFFIEYVEYIKPYIMAANGTVKKAIIFDCDNTLWKGIVGEDGFDGIKMSLGSKDGAVFFEVQQMALALKNRGVLIGLCSKNNFNDVDEVIKNHPDMQLRDEDIAVKKIGWMDKSESLQEIASELNIGLDSLVYVDDSDFEVNLVKEQIPEITVLQVPGKLYRYPAVFRENLGLFYNPSITEEDIKKLDLYKQQEKRERVKKEYSNIEEYLTSLGLKLTISKDDDSKISRLAQLTQKTNQFNLTTKRYTEGDINNFIKDDKKNIFAFSVTDRFGDSGITGMSIVDMDVVEKTAFIDSFLMSCRVIGRNLEYAFMDYIITYLKKRGIKTVKSVYLKSNKNEQVEDFYEKNSFVVNTSNEGEKKYILDVKDYCPKQLQYIEVNDGK